MKAIVSYPKSGRTWLRYACTLADVDVEFTHAGIYTVAQRIGEPWPGVDQELLKANPIFLHRNPIDTAVSLFYQILKKDVRPGRKTWRFAENRRVPMPPQDIDRFVLDPVYGVEMCCRYNREWLDALGEDYRYVFTYEGFQADPVGQFRRLFYNLGAPIAAENAQEYADKSTFENMRKLQASKDGHKYRLTIPYKDPDAAKVRKGQVGAYVQDLWPDTVKKVRKIADEWGFEA